MGDYKYEKWTWYIREYYNEDYWDLRIKRRVNDLIIIKD
jgi:hypothetical protein